MKAGNYKDSLDIVVSAGHARIIIRFVPDPVPWGGGGGVYIQGKV